jgi:hypothetical protein
MGEHTRLGGRPHDGRPGSLGEMIHAAVRRAIEVAVEEELTATLGAPGNARDGAAVGIGMAPSPDADGTDGPRGPDRPPCHRVHPGRIPGVPVGPCCRGTSAACTRSTRR